jgi:phosphatidylserine/phosphatidylglycerophosphate/cardiolipin synthase-like enzyme
MSGIRRSHRRGGARPRGAFGRALTALVGVLTLTGVLVLGGAPQAAALTKPVVNGPVFNDPFGTEDQREAVFTQLVRLIDATPSGQQIRGSMFQFGDQEVADALLRAHQRGVDVKLIVDDSTYVDGKTGIEFDNPAYDFLKSALGNDDTARSWIVVCDDKVEKPDTADDAKRGCLGVAPPGPAYNHNKYFLFSRIGPFADGTSYGKVVFQTSSNLTDWYKKESFNDAVTFTDGPVYDGYAAYHEKQRHGRTLQAGNNNVYFSTPTGSTYRGYFFPRGDSSANGYNNPATDTVVNVLDEVACSYTGTDGKRHQTDIRIVTTYFNDSRIQVADKLAALRAQGCWIDIIYAHVEPKVIAKLDAAGIQHRKCRIPNGTNTVVSPHNKQLLIDGDYNGDITPRVYTGSANLTGSSLRSADEAMVRITGADYHAKYLSTFYKIRTACGG